MDGDSIGEGQVRKTHSFVGSTLEMIRIRVSTRKLGHYYGVTKEIFT